MSQLNISSSSKFGKFPKIDDIEWEEVFDSKPTRFLEKQVVSVAFATDGASSSEKYKKKYNPCIENNLKP